MSQRVNPKINALKFSNPSRVFAVDVRARSMEMTERESREWTFECRGLKMGIFRRLEDANFCKRMKCKKSCGPG